MSDELTLDQAAYCHERADARRKVWANDRREEMAKAIQQYWQGPSGRAWDGHEKSCCELLPGQADWFRRLADVVLAKAQERTLARS